MADRRPPCKAPAGALKAAIGLARRPHAGYSFANAAAMRDAEETMTDIQPIEIDGKHYVDVTIDGQELQRCRPLHDMNEAQAMAARFGAR